MIGSLHQHNRARRVPGTGPPEAATLRSLEVGRLPARPARPRPSLRRQQAWRTGAAAEAQLGWKVSVSTMRTPPGGWRSGLDAQQLAAVTAPPRPLLVLAGAGTGKTRTLTCRCAWLLEQGVAPERLLLLTFTNRAAREMVSRLEVLAGGGAGRLWAGTFHHVGQRLLRAHGAALGLPSEFEVLSPVQAAEVLQASLDSVAGRGRELRLQPAERVLTWISAATNQGQPLRTWIAEQAPPHAALVDSYDEAAQHYADAKVRLGRLDFDDLLLGWGLLLAEVPAVAAELRAAFDAVLVDEYQDINELQADLVESMAAPHRNLTLVGDDAQAIYGFRGASHARILSLPQRLPDLQVLRLEHNYRSSPEILAVANRTLRHNTSGFRKELRPTCPSGPLPALVRCADEQAQARWVAEELLSLAAAGVGWGDCAVLYRTHRDGERVIAALAVAGIPCARRGGASGAVAAPEEETVGGATPQAAGPSVGDGSTGPARAAVTCSSVHQAKGLEWSAVFVLNLVEGCFPLAIAARTAAAIEEERRLFHVAVTRAQRHLFLLCPERRSRGEGPGAATTTSRFLMELRAEPPLLVPRVVPV